MGEVTKAVLSDEEVARYHADGLLIPEYRLPEEVLGEVRTLIQGLIARNPNVPPELLLNVNVEDGSLGEVIGNREFLRYAAYPPFLDLLEQILGPDIILWDCVVFCKPPVRGKAIPFHQDSPYLVRIKPIVTATIWIAVDPTSAENGCLRFIPGSHKRGVMDHIRLEGDVLLGFETGLDPAQMDERKARDVALEAGQFCIFHAHTVHGSMPNLSGKRRAALAFRYMPGTSLYDDAAPSLLDANGDPIEPVGRPIYLLRGQDRTGQNVFTDLPSFATA